MQILPPHHRNAVQTLDYYHFVPSLQKDLFLHLLNCPVNQNHQSLPIPVLLLQYPLPPPLSFLRCFKNLPNQRIPFFFFVSPSTSSVSFFFFSILNDKTSLKCHLVYSQQHLKGGLCLIYGKIVFNL